MIEITETEALNRVAAYCSTAEHCRAEIAEKLQRWGIAYDAIDRIINRLEQEKYIDEERFCRAFINDKYRFAKWGKMKIGQALQLKKISSSVYWPYLNEIDEEEYHAVLQKLWRQSQGRLHLRQSGMAKERLRIRPIQPVGRRLWGFTP
jgi:regulatory protein